MTSFVVGKTRCPKCAKLDHDRRGDNLAEYSDGHKYCFKCGYYEHGSISYRIRAAVSNDPPPKELVDIALPDDVCPATSGAGYHWLSKYGITTHEILLNKILWSEEKQFLYFTMFDNNELIGWQARVFDTTKRYKYLTKGKIKDNLYVKGKGKTLVLVEDIVSCIKVARCTSALAILGSIITPQLLTRLKLYDDLIIWLDPDKQMDSIRYSRIANSLGIPTRTLLMDKDPKDYSTEEIKCLISDLK